MSLNNWVHLVRDFCRKVSKGLQKGLQKGVQRVSKTLKPLKVPVQFGQPRWVPEIGPVQKVFKTSKTPFRAPKCHFDKAPKTQKMIKMMENDAGPHSKHTSTSRNTGLLLVSL